jgi:two-component system, NtrC family, response regulator AlgB
MLLAEKGSEVAALGRMAHDHSPRRDRRFLSLFCPSLRELSQALVEVQGGSLFLHEVGALAPSLQARLLRVLDSASTREETTRVISATTHDLGEDIVAGRFRRDLFFRLNVVEVRVPPLRERREDILPIARDIIASVSAELGRGVPTLSVQAEAVLMDYRWPANLRELKNVIERALLLRPSDVVDPEALTEIGIGEAGRTRVGDDITLRELEWEHIVGVMGRAKDLQDAAAVLGISKSTLWRRGMKDQREPSTKVGIKRNR